MEDFKCEICISGDRSSFLYVDHHVEMTWNEAERSWTNKRVVNFTAPVTGLLTKLECKVNGEVLFTGTLDLMVHHGDVVTFSAGDIAVSFTPCPVCLSRDSVPEVGTEDWIKVRHSLKDIEKSLAS